MPTYKLRKEKKSSKSDVLIDPSQVSVVGPVDLNQSVASVASSPSNVSMDDSFKKELSDLKDEWSTRFACIEALLTMGSNSLSVQPLSAVGNIAPVFSPVKVKVTHPPPTGVLSFSPFLPHIVSPPKLPPAGSAPGQGQEQVLELEASVDKHQPETFSSRNPLLLSQSLRFLLHHWKIFIWPGPRTQNLHLGYRTGNQSVMMICRKIKLPVLRLTLRKKTGLFQSIRLTGRRLEV